MNRPHPHLFEISTVPWLLELSRVHNRKITLANVPDIEWDRIREFGIDWVWLMGVWKKSPAGRLISQKSSDLRPAFDVALPDWTPEDIVGSPYSIQAYEPDPETGDWSALAQARRQLDRRGMGLIVDFVPNHTGPDHDWASTRPELYVQGSRADFQANPQAYFEIETGGGAVYLAKGRDPFFEPWQDTVQLNCFNIETRRALLGILRLIREQADGVRCDMAMLSLNGVFGRTWGRLLRAPAPKTEFWEEARSAAPGLILIGEAYWDTEWQLQQLGFDYVYDKRLYDRCRHASAEEIRRHLAADFEYQKRLVRFIENHDEPRSAAVFQERRLQSAATLVATLPGLRLFNQGQFEGKTIHLPVQMAQARKEETDAGILRFYRALMAIVDDRCFHEGRWRLLEARPFEGASHRNLICCLWRSGPEARLVVINFSDGMSQGRVPLAGDVDPNRRYCVHDLLTGEKYARDGRQMSAEGLHVVLAGQTSHIFRFE